MLDTKKLQEIAQEMAETQKAMEQSGDATPVWTLAEVARQNLLDNWTEDAGAWGLDLDDTETRDQLWDMVVEAYFGPSASPDLETENAHYVDNDTNKEEKTMSNTFRSITGIEYTSNDLQTRFYTIDAEGKKTRISRKAYEEAKADHETWVEEQKRLDEEQQIMIDEAWEAEAEEERKAREDKIAEDAKATEDAVNGIVATLTEEKPEKGKKKAKKEKIGKKDQPKAEAKEKAKKTRKSKDIAHEHKDGEVTITLTAKQVDFVLHLSDSCFWEQGLDSILWCDVLCDEIGGQFEGKPMTIGAMISTLCEKGLGIRTKDRLTDATTGKSRKGTTFQLTEKGKEIAKELGLH